MQRDVEIETEQDEFPELMHMEVEAEAEEDACSIVHRRPQGLPEIRHQAEHGEEGTYHLAAGVPGSRT